MKKESFETFREIGSFEKSNLIKDFPSCFNGFVRVVKYRITIEEIEEPVEVIRQRLQDLWDNCDNMHHWEPLKQMANKYGYKLSNNAGSKIQRKK